MEGFNYSRRKLLGDRPYSAYASIILTVSGSNTDYSLKDNTSLFSNVTVAHEILIREGSTNFTFKLNESTNDAIPYESDSIFGISGFSVEDILVTTSGNTTFNIFTMGWK